MSISSSISRITEYYKRHGLAATFGRARLAGERALFAGRMVVFYCDLDVRRLPPVNVPKAMRLERLTALAELSEERLQAITSFWNKELASRNIRERFEKGASLWLVECEGQLAGYGWTLQGKRSLRTIFHSGRMTCSYLTFMFPPGFAVGQSIGFLLAIFSHTLAAEGRSRAFADTGEWNQAQLASFKMTPFRLLGYVRTYRVFGQLLNRWVASPPVEQGKKGRAPKGRAMKVLRSNE